jgi:hypothetical protein
VATAFALINPMCVRADFWNMPEKAHVRRRTTPSIEILAF